MECLSFPSFLPPTPPPSFPASSLGQSHPETRKLQPLEQVNTAHFTGQGLEEGRLRGPPTRLFHFECLLIEQLNFLN